MRTVAIIPARGGSKRIPGKNIELFHGKPIIAYSIETALESGLFDAVYVSTDSAEIAKVAAQYGSAIIMRPSELADDTTGTQAVMRHALDGLQFIEIACCIYPTAPLMSLSDLVAGWHAIAMRGALFSMSVGTKPLSDAGQFYWGRAGSFGVHELFAEMTNMVPVHESRVCDINTPDDWAKAEAMYAAL